MSLNLSAAYDSLCDMVIRPPRCNHYQPHDMGPTSFSIAGQSFIREDFVCSHFTPSDYHKSEKQIPCVIYCHGNSGCRLDSIECLKALLPHRISVVAFDFSGSGLSEGEYVSLGHFEKMDVKTVVEHLRKSGKISTIGLWGRSMGAVTSILYAKEDPSIAAMVLDSPFSCLYKVAEELVLSTVQKMPKFMISVGLKMVRSSIKKRAHFDIKELDIVPVAEKVFIPSLFAHGKDDTFVRPHHSEKIFEKYQGDKNRLLLDGDHNSDRPEFFFQSVCIFFTNHLKPDPLPEPKNNNFLFHGEFYDDTSIEEQQLGQAILLSLKEAQQNGNGNHPTTTTTTSTTTTTTTPPRTTPTTSPTTTSPRTTTTSPRRRSPPPKREAPYRFRKSDFVGDPYDNSNSYDNDDNDCNNNDNDCNNDD
ncbi:alpha/beta hydrolase fold-1 domain-containing protein [Cavenderia fasciculata]|uniref:Alpha/beta hydrolase fold-1 domain-containing protein n=1 Tax=Cavenderia fasciculata TaxID=261658 RepID=F4PQP3_CACFS|nr:alpha/beta hydrolase fold-1 domain-containing protein [Cavenderia fasciculata]EGG21210.1 alpha/beta hydrolase fold-1 domain-containing protein [Cavenderia fasciculata]|eukprot:XP_004359060.1 alpha/beta hydrolase fold-1 domain-containing protein [Cavenderia fasciculata]